MAADHELLSARLDRLEREGRRWRRVALGLGLALVGVVAGGAASTGGQSGAGDELRTRRLVLAGEDGSELAVLDVDQQGNPYLLLTKDERIGVLTLSGPGLLVRDGRRGAFLGVDARGATQLELTGDDLLQGVRASVQKDGSAGTYLLDAKGQRRAGFELLSTGHAQLTAFDSAGGMRLQSGVDSAGNASVLLLDPAGAARLGLVVPQDGVPTIASEDAQRRTRAQLIQGLDGEARLEFLGESGKVYERVPR